MSLRPRGVRDGREKRLVCRGGVEARRVLPFGRRSSWRGTGETGGRKGVGVRLQLSTVVLLSSVEPRLITGWQNIRVIASAGNPRWPKQPFGVSR